MNLMAIRVEQGDDPALIGQGNHTGRQRKAQGFPRRQPGRWKHEGFFLEVEDAPSLQVDRFRRCVEERDGFTAGIIADRVYKGRNDADTALKTLGRLDGMAGEVVGVPGLRLEGEEGATQRPSPPPSG